MGDCGDIRGKSRCKAARVGKLVIFARGERRTDLLRGLFADVRKT